jgi:hypothetical protein
MTIRNDATRLRIVTRDKRRQRAVVARQGQVLLDTDFERQSRHQLERIEIETGDELGSPNRLVVPAGNTGFMVAVIGNNFANLNIGGGRGYLNGWLLENTAICQLGTQPHPRADTVTANSIMVLKALIRHVDPVEEPALADVALGDAQAAGAALNDWQVFPLATSAPLTCANAMTKTQWLNLVAPSSGTLAMIVQQAAPGDNPCSLTPGGGYSRLENLLYRFEVHGGTQKSGAPTIDGPRFGLNNLKIKFSRRNASVMVRITNIVKSAASAEITVAPPALDPRNWFAPELFAELVSIHDDVDPRAAAASERLFRVASASDDKVVLQATTAQMDAAAAAPDGTWFLRLWDAFPDGSGTATVTVAGTSATSNDIDLGDGLKIRLGGGGTAFFRRGDYWTCAARADGTIDWPMTGNVADLMVPHGPETRYAPVAALTSATSPAEDCRIPFATLTDRVLLYRGGDGQSVFAGANATAMVALSGKLRVAVMRGETPVPGAFVRWSLPTETPPLPACQINGVACNAGSSPETQTLADGLTEVTWSIDPQQRLAVHKVQAALVTAPGSTGLPVVFTAVFETAEHTSYTPGKCSHLNGVNNVQDALDTLCGKIGDDSKPTMRLTAITLLNKKPVQTELIKDDIIQNGRELPFNVFDAGIQFKFDAGDPLGEIAPFDPVVEVELDLPYPMTDPDRLYWSVIAATQNGNVRTTIEGPFGFQRVRLDGQIKVGNGGLLWAPSGNAGRFIETVPQHAFGQKLTPQFGDQLKASGWTGKPPFERILCRLRLRSAFIWAEDPGTGQRIYLNAEHLGDKGNTTIRPLLTKEVDPQRAADLDMFIYLKPG